MITEKRFIHSYQSFWQALLPMMPRYVRNRNAGLERYLAPMQGGRPEPRGVINEGGFRAFASARSNGVAVQDLPPEEVEKCVGEALAFIVRFRTHDREQVVVPLAAERPEVVELAQRLEVFFHREPSDIVVWPNLPGCGWLDAAQADVLSPSTLYEVKAGDVAFRGHDLRQVLCYGALAHAAHLRVPEKVCIVNPRRGVYLSDTFEQLCLATAGVTAVDVFNSIISYISEPQWEEPF